jgi:hypothetical protein
VFEEFRDEPTESKILASSRVRGATIIRPAALLWWALQCEQHWLELPLKLV